MRISVSRRLAAAASISCCMRSSVAIVSAISARCLTAAASSVSTCWSSSTAAATFIVSADDHEEQVKLTVGDRARIDLDRRIEAAGAAAASSTAAKPKLSGDGKSPTPPAVRRQRRVDQFHGTCVQIFGGLLGLFLGPRGCFGLLFFLAVEIFVGVRFGGHAAVWAALAMLILAFLPIGMRNGRAGMMRVFQALLAFAGAVFALGAFVELTFGRTMDGRSWMTALAAIGCYFGFRWVGRMIERTETAAPATERLP